MQKWQLFRYRGTVLERPVLVKIDLNLASAVIQLISDSACQNVFLRMQPLSFFVFFGVFFKSQHISDPGIFQSDSESFTTENFLTFTEKLS